MKTGTKTKLVALFSACVGGVMLLVGDNYGFDRGYDEGIASLNDQMEILEFYQKCNGGEFPSPTVLKKTLFYTNQQNGRTAMAHPQFTCEGRVVKRIDRNGPSTL